MKLPIIADAKEIAQRYGLAAATIISFTADGRHIAFTGYGVDKNRCKALSEVSRQIDKAIRRGTIEIPPRLKIPLTKGSLGERGDNHADHDNGRAPAR